MTSFSRVWLAVGCLLLARPVCAQTAPAPIAQPDDGGMATIIVKGQALRPEEGAYSATRLDQTQIRQERVSQVQELFRLVPGMNVLDYGLPGVGSAVVIRGFGGGGHGGDLGTVIDGIPLNEAMSHADGYVDFSVVVPLEIDTVTVYKGPVSALYGNFNRGGLVSLNTRKRGEYAQADVSLGAFDSFDVQAALGTVYAESHQFNLAAQLYHSDGFRPQSQSERGTFSGRWAYTVTPALELALSTRLHHAHSDSASYLTQAQFEADPYGIDPGAQNDGAKKQFSTLRLDVNYALQPRLKLLSFLYTTQQDFTRWFSRPVNAIDWRQREEAYARAVVGAGVNLNGRHRLAARPLNWVAGVETFRERTDYAYYDGLDHRQRLTAAISDRRAQLDSVSAFAEAEATLHRLFMPSLGLRYDRFGGDCRLKGPETGGSPCDDFNEMDHLSPKLGARMLPWSWLVLRGSFAEGFALPGGFIKYAASAASLEPNLFRQTEVGFELQPGAGLTLDVAVFDVRSTQEVRALSTGEYENHGATSRRGVETSLRWTPVEAVALSAVHSLTDSEITDNGDPALIGNRVAGVSRHAATLNGTWSPSQDWTLDASWRLVGAYAIDVANTESARRYATLDLGVSQQLRLAAHSYRWYAGLDNVTDKVYSASVSRIGGQTLHAPAAPRTLRVGVQFDF